MPPAGFEPTVSAGERPQTYALNRAATGTGTSAANLQRRFAADAQLAGRKISQRELTICIQYMMPLRF